MNIAVEAKGLSYTYPNGTRAIEGISFNVRQGETVGIIGPNGAGKTTLLLHLNGILQGNGEVTILGLEMKKGDIKKIRSKIGLVFQNPDDQLFCPTVFEDVSFGPLNMKLPEEEVIKRTREALCAVEMDKFENNSPHHLSFGEKKRISIATVLSMKPEILLLDEPTSNLDPQHRRRLIRFLKEIKATKIIASHDLEMILELCERVILLNKGKMLCSGKTFDIMKDKDLMENNRLEVPLSILLS